MIINSDNFKVEYVNKKINSFLGYQNQDVLNKSFLGFLHTSNINSIIKDLKSEIKLKKTHEVQVKDKRNKYHQFKIILNPITHKLKEKKILVTFQSYSEKLFWNEKTKTQDNDLKSITKSIPEIRFWKLFTPKKYDNALQVSYNMLQTVIDNIPQFIIWKDKDLNYLGCNENFAKFIGLRNVESVIGKREDDLFKYIKVPNHTKAEKEVIDTNVAQLNETETWKLENDSKLYMIVNRIPMQDSEKKTKGILITYDNITELLITEAELRKDRNLLERIIKTSLTGILMVDKHGKIIFANSQAEKVLELEKNETDKYNYRDPNWKITDFKGNIIKKSKLPFQKVQKLKKPIFNIQNAITWPDGRKKLLSINISPLFDDKGKFDGMVANIEDITKKIIAEKKIVESEKRFRHLFESSPYAILIINNQGIIVNCNSAINNILSYHKPEDLLGKNFRDVLSFVQENKILIDDFERKLNKFLEDGKEVSFEFPLYQTIGNKIWLNLAASLVKLENRSFIQIILQDITEKKLAEKVLRESRERFRNLLDTSSVGILEIDMQQSRLSYINPKLADILGFKERTKISEQALIELIHPRDLEKFFDSPENKDLQFRINDKEGNLKWLSGKRVNSYDDLGEIKSFRLWLEDVTEKKLYENLIIELNTNFLNFTTDIEKNIISLLTTCNILLNSDICIYVNKIEEHPKKHYLVILDSGKIEEINPKDFESNYFINSLFNNNDDSIQVHKNLDISEYRNSDPYIRKWNLKGSFTRPIKIDNKINSVISVFFNSIRNLREEDQMVLYLISNAIEIEQRRWEVKKHLKEQNIKLSEINKLKTELLTRTSHELKTPLISIKGYNELFLTMYKDQLDQEMVETLHYIDKGCKRLERIINSLLKASKLEKDKFNLHLAENNLTHVIEKVIEEIKPIAQLRNIEINLDISKSMITKFDRKRIHEVFSNLTINALKYTPPGGNIFIHSTIKENHYVISIKDTGIGFTEKEKSVLFTQFGKIERYGKGWDVDSEGTGMGLYISKKIVELHGGTIWMDSKGRDKGSVFHFSLKKSP
jgi:PAS domain S-box-containing protein